jgi:hypothetical protein
MSGLSDAELDAVLHLLREWLLAELERTMPPEYVEQRLAEVKAAVAN